MGLISLGHEKKGFTLIEEKGPQNLKSKCFNQLHLYRMQDADHRQVLSSFRRHLQDYAIATKQNLLCINPWNWFDRYCSPLISFYFTITVNGLQQTEEFP